MNISILLGKGIEGCGVTKYALEMLDYLKETDHTYKLYIINDKKFARDNAHDFSAHNEHINIFKSKETEKLDSAIEDIKKTDALIMLSFPTKSYEQESVDAVKKLIHEVQNSTKMCYTHHNHSKNFMSKEVIIDDILDSLDLVFTHSDTNPLNKIIEKRYGTFKGYENVKIFPINPSIQTQKLKDKYWKDISAYDKKKVTWIGRTTPLKGYDLCMDFHENHLKNNGFKTTMHGMDKGPAIIGFKQTWKDKYRFMDAKNLLETDENICDIYGPYVQDEMMQELSTSGFILQLTKFKEADFNKSFSLEFTHIEACCLGSIPIFRKEYGEQCISRTTGKPIIEEDNGILYLSEDNESEIYDMIEKINADDSLREEMRTKAFDFIQAQSDSDVVFKEFFRVVQEETSGIKTVEQGVVAGGLDDEW